MKKIATYLGSVISILSLAYFSVVYYDKGEIKFDAYFTRIALLLVLIMTISLLVGISNKYKLDKVIKQNEVLIVKNDELVNLVKELYKQNDNNHDEVLHVMQNSREISLDVYNKIKEGD